MSDVVAVIPTFRPSAEHLLPLASELLAAELPLMVSDDGSACTADRLLEAVQAMGAQVTRHRRNAGIARGLNDGLRFAESHGAAWLLTLDQDSMVTADYVADLTQAAQDATGRLGMDAVGAVAAGIIGDASGPLGYPLLNDHGLTTTAEVIQTGTAWSVPGLIAMGGFDESFGIDAVDAAACVRLRAQGRRIIVVPTLTVGHRLGEARQYTLLGRPVLASGHSPDRRTTIIRNRLRLAPEELRESPVQAFRSLRRVAASTVLAVTVEDDRWEKAKASARGLFPRRGR